MNYREFTERVYNYKHGLTNSAESQNIEHSAKQTEEINENEHIEHSGQGQTWDQHKYIRKEYLGNGNWRYIYEDGSSNVVNAPNAAESDQKANAVKSESASKPTKANPYDETTQKEKLQRAIQNGKYDSAFVETVQNVSERMSNDDYNKEYEKYLKDPYGYLSTFNDTAYLNSKANDLTDAQKIDMLYGNGAPQNAKTISDTAKKLMTPRGQSSPADAEFTQARKDMYKELGEKAADYNKQLEGFQGVAKGLAQSNADQEAAKLKIQAGNIADNLGASQKETEDRKMYVDLENKARDYNSQLEGFQGVTKSLEQSNADQAESARQLEKEALASKAQARSDRYDKMANLDVNTGATPLNQLTNQGTTASQNAQAQTILNNYEDAIVTDVLEPLRALGIPDEAIWASIEKVENEVAGEAITNSLRDIGSAKQVLFFPGAEEGLKVYRDQVMPALKDMVAVETLTRKDNKVNDIVASLDDEEKAIMLRALTK